MSTGKWQIVNGVKYDVKFGIVQEVEGIEEIEGIEEMKEEGFGIRAHTKDILYFKNYIVEKKDGNVSIKRRRIN